MICATIIVVVGGSIAKYAITKSDRTWWVVIGGFIVAIVAILVGYDLFRTGVVFFGS